jgi:ATP-dependent helicase/DNAse subunit B
MNKRPPGTRVLSAKEHSETLESLLRRKQELAEQIEHMSVTLYTTRAQNQLRGFVQRMEEVDHAIQIYERQRVIITN